jgi:DNA-binding CsgD family transcriptional regulator
MAALDLENIERVSTSESSRARIAEDFEFGAFAANIAAASSGDEVWQIIEAICRKTDVNGVCCRCFPSEAAAEQVIFFSTTTEFSPKLSHALQNSPGYLDAFLHAAVRTTKPFLWTDIDQILEPRSPQLRHYKEQIAGLGTGVVVPVFGPLFRNGYFCFHSQDDRNIDDMDMMVLHSISQTAYLKLLDIMYKTSGRERTLSGRELEAINMIARGKSNPEVATAMSVSVNTVNTVLKRIFEKLDVSDRVSAVMRAYALGYIA